MFFKEWISLQLEGAIKRWDLLLKYFKVFAMISQKTFE